MPQINQCPYCYKKMLISSYAMTEHFSSCKEYNKQLKEKIKNDRKNRKEKIRYY